MVSYLAHDFFNWGLALALFVDYAAFSWSIAQIQLVPLTWTRLREAMTTRSSSHQSRVEGEGAETPAEKEHAEEEQ